jgi:maltose O-acetyltransferase
MTEWEKLQAGEVYNDFDKDLFDRRVEAKKLFRAYNATADEETEKRADLMRRLFKSVGNNVWVEPDFRCEFGKNITIGNDVYINFGCVILDCGQITIGNQVLVGPNVGFYSANHALDAKERMDGALVPGDVNVGNRVWIGGGSIILAGVTIGDDTVIGAGSVVTRDIPSGVVAVGNPCRVLRKLTEKDKIGYRPEEH